MVEVVELNARERASFGTRVSDGLLNRDAIIVLRDVEEIYELGAAIERVAAGCDGAEMGRDVTELLRTRRVKRVEVLSALYRACRHLRDSRYVSGLFSDLIAGFGLPNPLLIDTGHFRIGATTHRSQYSKRPDLFDPDPNADRGPNEAEPMLGGGGWGSIHRDIDVQHYHFQVNFWFPLHDIDQAHSLPLFPDAYRQDVVQYNNMGDPEQPDQWGAGKVLQIPLKFGDTLLFHSQQLHGSPYMAPGQNRFTVELRVAAACVDDNANIYRRLFWNSVNFRHEEEQKLPVSVRAAELAEPSSPAATLSHVLAGRTAHAVFERLFRDKAASMAAGYCNRPEPLLDNAMVFGEAAWRQILERLAKLPTGEDLDLAVARIVLRQGFRDLAATALSRLCRRTKSYFWALEAGRIAANARLYEPAMMAFAVAEIRASTSGVALNQYARNMPPSRNRDGVLQLLPATARRAAVAFAARARIESIQSARTTLTFNHELFWEPRIVASFENYDVVMTHNTLVGLPVGRAFHPEELLDNPEGIVVADTIEELSAGLMRFPLGQQLPEPRMTRGQSIAVGDWVVQRYLNGWYVIPKERMPIRFWPEDVLRVPGVFRLSPDMRSDAMYAVVNILAANVEKLNMENLHLRQMVGELQTQTSHGGR
jgi:hypothetical protein